MEEKKIQLECLIHDKQPIIYICDDPLSFENPLLCQICKELQVHQTNDLKKADDFVQNTANTIYRNYKQNQIYFDQIQSKYQSSIQYYANPSEHLNKVQNHIITQKIQIAEDFAIFQANISDCCQRIKTNMLERLDNYFKEYSDNFLKTKQSLDQTFSISQRYQYFKNPTNLQANLENQIIQQVPQLINNIKFALYKSNEAQQDPEYFEKNLCKQLDEINKAMENLPFYMGGELDEAFTKEIGSKIEEIFQQQLKITDIQKEAFLNRQIQLNVKDKIVKQELTKRLSEKKSDQKKKIFSTGQSQTFQQMNIKLKEEKQLISFKVQEEIININCDNLFNMENLRLIQVNRINTGIKSEFLEIIAEDIIALSSDRSLIIYDILQQKILHEIDMGSKIICMQQINDPSEESFQDKMLSSLRLKDPKLKCSLLSLSLSDQTIQLWRMVPNPFIGYEWKPEFFKKLIGSLSNVHYICDLNDGQNIVTGDDKSEIIIWDIINGKILFAFRGQHQFPIKDIFKKLPQIMVILSTDNTMSFWKLQYENKILVQCECFKIIQQAFSGKVQSFIKQSNLNSTIGLICCDEKIRIYDEESDNIITEIQTNSIIQQQFIIQQDSLNVQWIICVDTNYQVQIFQLLQKEDRFYFSNKYSLIQIKNNFINLDGLQGSFKIKICSIKQIPYCILATNQGAIAKLQIENI